MADEPALAAALCCTEIPTFFNDFPNQYLELKCFHGASKQTQDLVGFFRVCRSIMENGLDIKAKDMKFTTLHIVSLFA